MRLHGSPSARSQVLASLAILTCVVVVFYSVPLSPEVGHLSAVAGVLLFVAGMGGMMWLISRQAGGLAGPMRPRGRLLVMLSVVYVVVIFFALAYYVIERSSPGQFSGLQTRTDALYYSVVTLGTVGYGDVHAVGQVARAVTVVQITFDLVVIGLLLAFASSLVVAQVSASRGSAPPAGGSGTS